MRPSFPARALVAIVLALAPAARAADPGWPGGPAPAGLDALFATLRADPYDLELLLGFGTGPGVAAGSLAIARRDGAAGDDAVYPVNARSAGTVTVVPKREYLFGTTSSLGAGARFGFDFGRAYRHSVIGVRAYGVPPAERESLAELRSAMDGAPGNPTRTALGILDAWASKGYRMDVVHYRKSGVSEYFDPREADMVAFRYLPDRFPSVLPGDFARAHDRYRDEDNLRAMYLLFNLTRYVVGFDAAGRAVALVRRFTPRPYAEALRIAEESARADASAYRQRETFKPRGKGYDDTPDNEPSGDAMPDSAPC